MMPAVERGSADHQDRGSVEDTPAKFEIADCTFGINYVRKPKRFPLVPERLRPLHKVQYEPARLDSQGIVTEPAHLVGWKHEPQRDALRDALGAITRHITEQDTP